jgi:multidrug efflux system membrane fusion protein
MDKQIPAPPEHPLLTPPEEKKLLPKPPVRRRRWPWLLLFLAIIAAGFYFLWPKKGDLQAGKADTGAGAGRRGRGGAGGITPVVATRAKKGNIGVYFTGLGSVTPIYTVTVKSRVDGQLMAVHYKEGDVVRQNDPLVEIDPRPFQVQLEQAEGTLLKDQALLENARLDLKRYQTLVAQNAVPEQQVATQAATVKQLEGQVKSDQGQVDNAKLNLTYTQITAPITGRIGLRLMDPGNIVHASDPSGLLVITQIQPISVIFTIAEDQLPPVMRRMRAGQRLSVDAFDREMKNRIAQGQLTTIDNQIDQTTGTLKLRATFPNSNNALFPNQFVNARLLVQQKTGVTLLPTAAIQRNSQMTYVYFVKPDSTVTVRPVTLGTTEGDQSEIASGLNPGDVVVMIGVDKLQEGSKVAAHIEGEPEPGGVGGNGGRSGNGGSGPPGGRGPGGARPAGGQKK